MRRGIATCLTMALAGGNAALAQPLTADLSDHLITITSSYTGTELLLFGSVEEEGDIIVVVRGPEQQVLVRRKERVGGLWMNRATQSFAKVPGYYAMAATRPLDEIATENVLSRLGIGPKNLTFEANGSGGPQGVEFRDALVRNMTREGLYPTEPGVVTWLGSRLFRTNIAFPANAPVGNYTAEIYLLHQNEVITAQTTPLFIRKTGIERAVFEYSRNYPLLYGLSAVIMALLAGWLAELAFRRR